MATVDVTKLNCSGLTFVSVITVKVTTVAAAAIRQVSGEFTALQPTGNANFLTSIFHKVHFVANLLLTVAVKEGHPSTCGQYFVKIWIRI